MLFFVYFFMHKNKLVQKEIVKHIAWKYLKFDSLR